MKKTPVTPILLGEKESLFPKSYSPVKPADRARYITFHRELQHCSVEEDVKAAYRKFFSLAQDSSQHHDLYTHQMLFEFKYDKRFMNKHVRAETLAQLLYYVHRLKYDADTNTIPPFLCMADYKEAVVTETKTWESFVENTRYDWTAAPSSPDVALISDLEVTESLACLRVFHLFDLTDLMYLDDFFHRVYDNDFDKSLIVKKDITERNFEDVYQYWLRRFGEDVRNGYKPSQYFICDIQEGKSFIRTDISRVSFDIEEGVSRNKKLDLRAYAEFWEMYNKNRSGNIDTLRGILSKADRLSDDRERRFEGEFYTPIPLARKAIDYLDSVIGGELKQIDWDSGKYRLWDMACGTGNLEYHLPSKAYRYCYMSTLRPEDVIYCKTAFGDATVFQYNYLNDDILKVIKRDATLGWIMPERLVADLADPELTWIIFINPPFATAQNKADASESKRSVSMTAVQTMMTAENLGETSRELFSQFLYRIHYEFKGKKAYLGMFSTLKYLNSNNDQKLRDKVFHYKFERGFIFDARVFDGVKGAFPIGFLVWNLQHQIPDFDSQEIAVEKCKRNGDAFDKKQLGIIHRSELLNRWPVRPAGTRNFPPFSSALNINAAKSDIRDRISANFICSLCSKGNDMQNNNSVALFSGPYGSAGAFSVTSENFLKSMIIHAVRKTAQGDWSNDRDQFYIPFNRYFPEEVIQMLGYADGTAPDPFPMEFARDCVIWSLFAPSNQTVAMKDVSYNGTTFQIHNNLFPFTIDEVKRWGIQDADIAMTIAAESENRFAAQWVVNNKSELSHASQNVLTAAKALYKLYFTNLNSLHTTRYKIQTWDAGRYQIYNALEEADMGIEERSRLDTENKKLGAKIRGQLYTLGFLR